MEDYLKGKIVDVKDLDNAAKKSMFVLLSENFEGYSEENFERDLSEKSKVILLENSNREIGGFTTIQDFSLKYEERNVRVIYSGDTIVSPMYWNRHDLFKVWLNYAFGKKKESEDSLYWFLICSGCRTYKMLPAFFNDFYPRFDAENGEKYKGLLDSIAKHKFGEEYDEISGIIRFRNSNERLNNELAKISGDSLKNPHVSYFANKNPGYYKGDELSCLVEISLENMRPAGLKVLL